jgi:hypothetical protein
MSDSHVFYGIYRGVCIDNADPQNKNRIRLKVPQVLHTNVTNWASPCLPVVINGAQKVTEASSVSNTSSSGTPAHTHGISHTHALVYEKAKQIPSLNQGVWVMFEGGDPNFPVWIGVY